MNDPPSRKAADRATKSRALLYKAMDAAMRTVITPVELFLEQKLRERRPRRRGN